MIDNGGIVCVICKQVKPRYQKYARCRECQLAIKVLNYHETYKSKSVPRQNEKYKQDPKFREREKQRARSIADEKARTRLTNPDGKVYFLEETKSKRIKTGYTTKKPEARMAELQCGNPDVLRLVLWYPGTMFDETEIKRRFRAHLIRGEWFRPASEILQHIASYQGENEHGTYQSVRSREQQLSRE